MSRRPSLPSRDWLQAPLATLRRCIRAARLAAAERDARVVLDSFEPDFLERMGLTREDLRAAMRKSPARSDVDRS